MSWNVPQGARLLVLLEREPPIKLDEGVWDASNCVLRGELEFRGVDFAYDTENPDAPAILENFSLKVAAGTKVGLVGSSGVIERSHRVTALRVTAKSSTEVGLVGSSATEGSRRAIALRYV